MVAGTDVTISLAIVVMLPLLVWPVSIDTGFGLGDCDLGSTDAVATF
jgi:hypothetical protein